MKTVGIIAEYNPFHNGHSYHIEEAKKLTGADTVLVVMSGNFVQRGAPAICDKWLRTNAALLGGADAVFELPTAFATSSAEIFAEAAVKLLYSLGCTDAICFGSECGDIRELKSLAEILADEPAEYSLLLKKHLKAGLSYPLARCKALGDYFLSKTGSDTGLSITPDRLTELLSEPNNILGLEYCKALSRLCTGKAVRPVPVPYTLKRSGNGYNDNTISDSSFSSASAIRQLIFDCDADFDCLKSACTEHTFSLIESNFNKRLPISEDDFSDALYLRLLSLKTDELTAFQDVSTALANRISGLSGHPFTFREAISKVKTKNLTYSAVSRALLHILLNVKSELISSLHSSSHLPYARLLGMKKTASPALRAIQENSLCPVITKLADADTSIPLLKCDISAALLYNQIVRSRYGFCGKNDFESSPVII